MTETQPKHLAFERYMTSLVAFLCAAVLILITLWGPLGMGVMQHRTSQSGIYQVMGQDLVDLLLMVPLLLIAGVLHLLKRDGAKYFLILPPITLIYTGLSYGIGQEWSNPAITGNIEQFSWMFLIMMIGGLILGISSMSLFKDNDAPEFKRKSLLRYAVLLSVFLLFFMFMWMSELFEVATVGTTSSGAYDTAPTAFWVIRYLDLGVSIPLGFVSIYMLLTRPKKAYPVILLFFGFFITLGSAVNGMAVVQLLSGDPEVAGAVIGGLVIFPVLGILAYAGLYYLVRDKISNYMNSRQGTSVVA